MKPVAGVSLTDSKVVQYGRLRKLAPLPLIGSAPLPLIQPSQLGAVPARACALTDAASGVSMAPTRELSADGIEALLMAMDASILAEWEERTSGGRRDLLAWWATDQHAVEFSHFWLCEMHDDKRRSLFEMEATLAADELRLALHMLEGLNPAEPARLFQALVPEYPDCFAGDGTAFLDLLTMLVSTHDSDFETLTAGAALAHETSLEARGRARTARAFALASLLTAVTAFYRDLCQLEEEAGGTRPGTSAGARPATASKRIEVRPRTAQQRPTTALQAATGVPEIEDVFQAAKLGFTDVVYYSLSRARVEPNVLDGLGRSLLFVAAVHQRHETVEYLLANAHLFDLDQPAHSGNTVLHSVVAVGDLPLTQMLLTSGANPLAINPLSGATPLDIATMMENQVKHLCFNS